MENLQINEFVSLLNDLLLNDQNRMSKIIQFQNRVWDLDASGGCYEILNSLAYVLDYYEPECSLRKEDPSFFGDDILEKEIRSGLKGLYRT